MKLIQYFLFFFVFSISLPFFAFADNGLTMKFVFPLGDNAAISICPLPQRTVNGCCADTNSIYTYSDRRFCCQPPNILLTDGTDSACCLSCPTDRPRVDWTGSTCGTCSYCSAPGEYFSTVNNINTCLSKPNPGCPDALWTGGDWYCPNCHRNGALFAAGLCPYDGSDANNMCQPAGASYSCSTSSMYAPGIGCWQTPTAGEMFVSIGCTTMAPCPQAAAQFAILFAERSHLFTVFLKEGNCAATGFHAPMHYGCDTACTQCQPIGANPYHYKHTGWTMNCATIDRILKHQCLRDDVVILESACPQTGATMNSTCDAAISYYSCETLFTRY